MYTKKLINKIKQEITNQERTLLADLNALSEVRNWIDTIDDPDREQWKSIDTHLGYEVSSHGRVRNVTAKILRSRDRRGYQSCNLTKNNTNTTFTIHRLVARAFCDNPDNCNVVDHIDRNRLNNHHKNLRWTTQSINCRNQSKSHNNTSGIKGVNYQKRDKSWVAEITDNYLKRISRSFSINKYDDAKHMAINWRKQKEQEYGYIVNSDDE